MPRARKRRGGVDACPKKRPADGRQLAARPGLSEADALKYKGVYKKGGGFQLMGPDGNYAGCRPTPDEAVRHPVLGWGGLFFHSEGGLTGAVSGNWGLADASRRGGVLEWRGRVLVRVARESGGRVGTEGRTASLPLHSHGGIAPKISVTPLSWTRPRAELHSTQ